MDATRARTTGAKRVSLLLITVILMVVLREPAGAAGAGLRLGARIPVPGIPEPARPPIIIEPPPAPPSPRSGPRPGPQPPAPTSELQAKAAINELVALPWEGLQEQLTRTAEEAARELELALDTGTKTVEVDLGPFDIKFFKYSMRMNLVESSLELDMSAPPGYDTLSDDHLELAIPLEDGWNADFYSRLEGTFRVWAGKLFSWTEEFSFSPHVAVRDFGITTDVWMDTAETDRPMLESFEIRPRGRVLIYDLIPLAPGVPVTLRLPEFTAIVKPGRVYRLEKEFADSGFSLDPLNIGAGVEAKVFFELLPVITVGIEGRFKFELPKVGVRSLPFKLMIPTGARLPEAIRDQLPLFEDGVPRAWGEDGVVEMDVPSASTDFVGPALELESLVVPNIPYGLVYEMYHRDPLFPGAGPLNPLDNLREGGAAPRPGRRGSSVVVDESTLEVGVAPGGADWEIDELWTERYEGFHDTAIWTGHYLAAEAFRFAAEGAPEAREQALERAKVVLGGVEKLFQVTGRPGLLARAALPNSSAIQTIKPLNDPPEGEEHRFYRDVLIDGELWSGFGRADKAPSRDSYIGVFLGLACAYELIDDAQVRSRVRELVTDALHYVLDNGWNVPTSSGESVTLLPGKGGFDPKVPALVENDTIVTSYIHNFTQQLALLRAGKTVNPEEFADEYDQAAKAARYAWIPVWGSTFDPIAQYFKFNLSHGALAILLLLEDDPALRADYEKAFRVLRRATGHHANAYFNLLRILTKRPQERQATMSETSLSNPAYTVAEETRALLRQWLWRWESVAGPNGLPTEATPDPEFLKSLFPFGVEEYETVFPGASQDGLGTFGRLIASPVALPVDKRPGRGMDFVWQRHPFATGLTIDIARLKNDLLEVYAPFLVDIFLSRDLMKPANWPNGFDLRDYLTVDEGKPHIEGPAVDYLLATWMAAYLGVVDGSAEPAAPVAKSASRLVPGPKDIPLFLRGDSNADGAVDISDPLTVLAFLFANDAQPRCVKASDANDDGRVDVSDAMTLLSFLFGGTETLPPPFSRCGIDPTEDSLPCEVTAACGPLVIY